MPITDPNPYAALGLYVHPKQYVCTGCYADVYRYGYPNPDTRACSTGHWEFPKPEYVKTSKKLYR